MLAIGKILKTHGVDGSVKVKSYSGKYSHFQKLEDACVNYKNRDVRLRVEKTKGGVKDIIVKFEGVDSIQAASKYINCEIWVERQHAAPIGDDEYYLADITGCELVHDGSTVGIIQSVIDMGYCDMFEVRKKKDDSVCLVPFKHEFIGTVDTAAGQVELLETWILE